MRIVVIMLVGLLGFFGSPLSAEEVQSSPNATGITLLIMGDSLSSAYGIPPDKGWVHLLSERIAQNQLPVTIVNKSINGTMTQNAADRYGILIDSVHPTITLLAVGSNDALRGVPAINIQKNLEKMILESQLRDVKVILTGFEIPPNYGPEYAARFKAIFSELAEKYTLPFIPFLLEGITTNTAYFLPDGVHPNEQAQPIILDNVWKILAPLIQPQ